jgi:ribonucleoside-triphosphate reductase
VFSQRPEALLPLGAFFIFQDATTASCFYISKIKEAPIMNSIKKRDGSVVPFSTEKIENAVRKAFVSTGERVSVALDANCRHIARDVAIQLDAVYADPVYIEDVQNEVEKSLMRASYDATAKAYILYRAERERQRDKNSRLMKTLYDIACSDAKDHDPLRENANIDGNTAMGTMLKFGSESAKTFYRAFVLSDQHRIGHEEGDIHIHDLDFLQLTMTCCQIDLTRLFKGGFGTGHGYLREPNSIGSYGALAAIAMQANQNDQHGGQSVPSFDRDMAPGVGKTLRKQFARLLSAGMGFVYHFGNGDYAEADEQVKEFLEDEDITLSSLGISKYLTQLASKIAREFSVDDNDRLFGIVATAAGRAILETERATHQAMESLIHNLNTMHSRAGAQVPFSSLNYGTDTSPEGRMVIRNVLKATIEGLGKGETPIFPIQVFKLKKGVNMEPGDPNYDLFKLALECSAKRMFPNFSFLDAPFNLQYYNPDDPQTEIAYMGCRTRVIGNVYDPSREIAHSRGNLSFTTINLPRIGIMSCGMGDFYARLQEKLELAASQLLERFSIQAAKKVYNFPFLMGQGVWLDSEKLGPNDTIGDVLRHGTLSIGFIGLAETLTRLLGSHHGESAEAQKMGLEIIGFMRRFCDKKAAETGLNFTLLATPAEGLSGRFVALDQARFGVIKGVTDKQYYTNSFHVPVSFDITACKKIQIEAPYHALTNAGHISYVEVDGDLANNLDAFESIVLYMGECGMGYGAVNHPVDRDPVCGYRGVIGEECPGCGRTEADGVSFENIRRITGYLVGTVERFNNAKRAEEQDRVKHVS